MVDNSRNSSNRVEVTVSGLHDEAKKWFRLSDEALAMHTRMLSPSVIEFSLPRPSPSVGDINDMYLDSHNSYLVLVNGAANEFKLIGDALNNSAAAYEASDGKSAGSFTDIPGS